MDQFRIAAAVVTGLLGLLFVIGFLRAFRERIYLCLLGLSFLALAANMLVAAPALAWLKWLLWGLTALLFAAAVLFAVVQTLAQMRLIRKRRAGLEREMWEYLEQLKQRPGHTDDEPGKPPTGGET
jgi:predicted membrane protein